MNLGNYYHNKVILITGASSGIGRATAMELIRFGSRLVFVARRSVQLDQLQKKLDPSQARVLSVKTDVTKKQDIHRLIKLTVQKWNKIDILISNAGSYFQRSIYDSDIMLFKKSMAVNFYASHLLISKILRLMRKQKSGTIVLVNSLDSKKGLVGDGPYVAAKAALEGYADVLRQEEKSNGIHVLSVHPGRVDTAMIEHIDVPRISKKISAEKVARAILNSIVKRKPSVIIPSLFYPLGALNDLFPTLMDWIYKQLRLEGDKEHPPAT